MGHHQFEAEHEQRYEKVNRFLEFARTFPESDQRYYAVVRDTILLHFFYRFRLHLARVQDPRYVCCDWLCLSFLYRHPNFGPIGRASYKCKIHKSSNVLFSPFSSRKEKKRK